MKKALLWILALTVLIFISGCSINIQKDQDTALLQQVNSLQQQMSWLEQTIKDLQAENTELKNKSSIVQHIKTTTPTPTQPKEMDNCPNGDKTISRYDWKCTEWYSYE
jgi:regulator of replication initiation timing